MSLAHFLDDLRCSCCGALNMLWLDPVRGFVECHECGQKAAVLVDPSDSLDSLDSYGFYGSRPSVGGDW